MRKLSENSRTTEVVGGTTPAKSELTLRRRFEERNGKAYTDEEWRQAKEALIGFFTILIERDGRSPQQKPERE